MVADNDKAVLLLTRPLTSAQEFAERVLAHGLPGLRPCFSPLLDITFRDNPIDYGDAAGVVFTSRHGVDAAVRFGSSLRLPCSCVGSATAQKARDAGWPVLTEAETASALIGKLTSDSTKGPLLHICGRERRGELAENLSRAGLTTREIVTYDQSLLPFSAGALRALNGPLPIIAPVFSPRTARHFARSHKGTAPLWPVAISRAAAEPLDCLDVAAICVAKRPNSDAMLDAIADTYERAIRVEGDRTED